MESREIQFSIMFFAASEETLQHNKYALVLEATKFADQNSFSSVWIPERHFAALGGLYPNPSVLHAALAVVTKRIQLRAGSVVLPIHHPIRVAEEWSLVDNLSHGRVGLSFASGWSPDDFAFFPEKYEERWEELFRLIPVVKKLWQGQSLTVTNGLGKEVEIKIYPRPVQADLPTWITAARSPDTFIKAGEIGANVLTHLLDQDVADVARKISLYREARDRNGYDPESGLVTMMLHTFVGEDAEEVREQGRKPYCDFLKANAPLLKALAASRDRPTDLESLSPEERDDFVNFLYDRFASKRALIGTPETCLDLVAQLRAMGVDEIACLLDFGPSYELVLQNLTHLNRLREICTSEVFNRSVVKQQAGSWLPAAPQQAVGISTQPSSARDVLKDIRDRCADMMSGAEFYQRLEESGLDVAPNMRGVQQVWRRDGEALGEVVLRDETSDGTNFTPAALLDACLQVSLAALPPSLASTTTAKAPYLPWALAKIEIGGRLTGRLFSHTRLAPDNDGGRKEIEGELRVFNQEGEPLAPTSTFQLRKPPLPLVSPGGVEQWFYELRWEEKTLDTKPASDESIAFLVLADQKGIGGTLARMLEEKGETVLLFEREQLLANAAAEAFVEESIFRKLELSVRKALQEWAGRRCAVIFMWGIDSIPPERMTRASLEMDQVMGSGSALSLIQLIGRLEGERLPKLWMITRGGQPVDTGAQTLQIAQSPLWGLGRTCAIEHPELWGGLIDLDPDAEDQENAASLINVVGAGSRENQVGFRRGKLFVPRLTRGRKLDPEPLALRADATYLITGGHKGIGFEVARWLVQRGVRHLCLVGRSPLPMGESRTELEAGNQDWRVAENIRALENAGAEVRYAAVDISDETGVMSLMTRLIEQGPPLRGIIHAASVWRDEHGKTLIRPLVNLNLSSLQQVFRPKLTGSWLLHKAFENTPLDFFVSFSSAASLTGSAGQGNYAAASVFLDALAHYRFQLGQRALSINWGPISGAGFGATQEGLKVHEYWESNGLKRISLEQLLKALEMLLPHSLSQLGVMNIDWEELGRFFPALGKAPWASYLVQSGKSDERSDFVERILGTPTEERQELLVNHLREQVAQVMGLKALPDARKKLFEMGMDSLMALELKSRLEKSLAADIRVTAVFNYPTIETLSGYLLKEVITPAVVAAGAAAPDVHVPEASALSRIKALSDDEVDRLLKAREV